MNSNLISFIQKRCSDAFFREERVMLEEKRQKIRLIQQRKVSEKELIDYKDLPQEIPLTLSIGHRVYSHICQPEEGVFLGTIAAVDPCDHTYRVVFDRASLGSQTVYDYEIKSVTPVQTIPIRAYIQTYRPKLNSSQNQISNKITNPQQTNQINLLIDDLNSINAMNNPAFAALMLQSNLDPVLGISSPFDNLNEITSQCQTPLKNSGVLTNATSGILGGFPIRLLLMITRLNKILNIKREMVTKLADLNTKAERMKANNQQCTKEFQTNYAVSVLELEKLNKDLTDYLNGVQRYCEEFAPEFKFSTNEMTIECQTQQVQFSKIEEIKEKLQIETVDIVEKLNTIEITPKPTKKITSKKILNLITKLTSLLLNLREYINSTTKDSHSNGLFPPYYIKFVNESVLEIKQSLGNDKTALLFEDMVQVHVNHIQASLSRYNKLHAFKYSNGQKGLENETVNVNNRNTENDNASNSAGSIVPIDDDQENISNEFENNEILEDIELEEEEDDEAETDDSFNGTHKFASCETIISPSHSRLKKTAFTKQKLNNNKSKKINETKRLNGNLSSFKAVLCTNSSLQ